jgi:hypothetical protein
MHPMTHGYLKSILMVGCAREVFRCGAGGLPWSNSGESILCGVAPLWSSYGTLMTLED